MKKNASVYKSDGMLREKEELIDSLKRENFDLKLKLYIEQKENEKLLQRIDNLTESINNLRNMVTKYQHAYKYFKKHSEREYLNLSQQYSAKNICEIDKNNSYPQCDLDGLSLNHSSMSDIGLNYNKYGAETNRNGNRPKASFKDRDNNNNIDNKYKYELQQQAQNLKRDIHLAYKIDVEKQVIQKKNGIDLNVIYKPSTDIVHIQNDDISESKSDSISKKSTLKSRFFFGCMSIPDTKDEPDKLAHQQNEVKTLQKHIIPRNSSIKRHQQR